MFPGGPSVLGSAKLKTGWCWTTWETLLGLKHRTTQIVHYDSPDRRGVDVGLLYRPEFFKVTSHRSVRLNIPDNPEFRTRDQLVVSGLLDGETIHIIVNHWPARSGGEKRSQPYRIAAAKLSRSIIDSIRATDADAKIILMGDLNDDPDSRSIIDYLGAKNNVKGEVRRPFHVMASLYREGIGTLATGLLEFFDNSIIHTSLISMTNHLGIL